MADQDNKVKVMVQYEVDRASAQTVMQENSTLTQTMTVPVQANRGPAGGVSSSAMGSAARTGGSASTSRQSPDLSPPAGRIPQHQTQGSIPAMSGRTSRKKSRAPIDPDYIEPTMQGSFTDMGGSYPASQSNRTLQMSNITSYGLQGGFFGPHSPSGSPNGYQLNPFLQNQVLPHPMASTAPIYPSAAGPAMNAGQYSFSQLANNGPGFRSQVSSFFNQIPGVDLNGYGGKFLRGAGMEVARYAGEQASLREQEILTGRRDIHGQASSVGGLIGGVGGAAIGSLFGGPFGTFLGAAVGHQVGSQVGGYMVARQVADITRQEYLQPIAAMSSNLSRNIGSFRPFVDSTDNGIGARAGGFQGRSWENPAIAVMEGMSTLANNRSDFIGRHYWQSKNDKTSDAYKDRYASPEQLASMYSGAFGSLVEAGIDPNSTMRTEGQGGVVLGHAGDAAITTGERTFGKRGRGKFGLINDLSAVADIAIGTAMNYRGRVDDSVMLPVYQAIAENAAKRYGKAGESIMSKQVDPILADLSNSAGNIADILMKHGVGATNSFVETTTQIGKAPRVNLDELMFVQRETQGDTRRLAFSGTKPRGQGFRAVSILGDEQSLIAGLPGGKESLTYAEIGENKRQASFRANREQDIMDYDLPMASLEGQEQRRQYLPNMPGYGLKLSLQRMGLRAPEIAKRSSRYASQVANGMLSEEEQLSQFNQIQGLENEQARDIGYLAEGGQDHALAFSGGRPSFFGRMDSISLARSAIWKSGSPQIGFGSQGGKQLGYQNDFFRQFDNSAFSAMDTMKPHSQTATQNGPWQSTGMSDKTLQDILRVLEQIANGGSNNRGNVPGGGARPGERWGNQADNQNSSVVPGARTDRSGF